MRAWIDGVKVEGTPREIAEFKGLSRAAVLHVNNLNAQQRESLHRKLKLRQRDKWLIYNGNPRKDNNRSFYSDKSTN